MTHSLLHVWCFICFHDDIQISRIACNSKRFWLRYNHCQREREHFWKCLSTQTDIYPLEMNVIREGESWKYGSFLLNHSFKFLFIFSIKLFKRVFETVHEISALDVCYSIFYFIFVLIKFWTHKGNCDENFRFSETFRFIIKSTDLKKKHNIWFQLGYSVFLVLL